MIVYKWVIKKGNQYFSLMNFNIFPSLENAKCCPYENGNIYSEYKDVLEEHFKKYKYSRSRFNIQGFHFWKEPKPKHFWKCYNDYLKRHKQPEINAILKCNINQEDIIIEDKERIIAKRFKILEEIK